MPDQTRQPLLTANLMCMASMFIWAASLPAAEPLIAALPPLPLTAMRMTLAAIALFPAWWIADGGRAVLRARWGRGLLIGALAFGGGAFLLVLGQLLSDPVTTAIVAASMPVVGIALEVALDGRRLNGLKPHRIGRMGIARGSLRPGGSRRGGGSPRRLSDGRRQKRESAKQKDRIQGPLHFQQCYRIRLNSTTVDSVRTESVEGRA